MRCAYRSTIEGKALGIREVVVEDSEGSAERLDVEMQKAVDAYRDPWLEREDPVTAGQFRTSLPLTVLPQVPVR